MFDSYSLKHGAYVIPHFQQMELSKRAQCSEDSLKITSSEKPTFSTEGTQFLRFHCFQSLIPTLMVNSCKRRAWFQGNFCLFEVQKEELLKWGVSPWQLELFLYKKSGRAVFLHSVTSLLKENILSSSYKKYTIFLMKLSFLGARPVLTAETTAHTLGVNLSFLFILHLPH